MGKKLSDLGPKPFRFNNSWLSKPGFIVLYETSWDSYPIYGWAAFILGKKLRLLKADLKAWSLSNQDQDVTALKTCDSMIKALKGYFRLRDLSHNELEDPNIVKEYAIKHFETLFSFHSGILAVVQFDWASIHLSPLPAHCCASLEAVFSVDEVKSVIKMFDGNKTPGQDGFSLQFFKKAWDFSEDDIMKMFSQFHGQPSL
ncbi:uncharacterized protein [Rutidosis leptorrhynchoides]|uniref:uncharacterized protein n=1 Tax=Rutidosis leptorrhynchoides TaxID=125765 RepID=UPI003A99B4AA